MYVLNFYRGRNLIKTKYYNSVGEIILADIAHYTNNGLIVTIHFDDVEDD